MQSEPFVIDWTRVERELRASGHARLGRLFGPAECALLRGLYPEAAPFRSRVVMQRHGFGRGEYQYFAYPLPDPVQCWREHCYAGLAPIARRWMADTRQPADYPDTLADFLAQCHAAGQSRPTPLLLRYGPGDYNCLHQDLYGEVAFPFQLVVGLSAPGLEYQGGELLLVESRPRMQSAGRVVPLGQGEAVVITTRYRPIEGQRGFYRANVRHGVSPVLSGSRYTLGIIFHDAT